MALAIAPATRRANSGLLSRNSSDRSIFYFSTSARCPWLYAPVPIASLFVQHRVSVVLRKNFGSSHLHTNVVSRAIVWTELDPRSCRTHRSSGHASRAVELNR